MTIRRFRSLLAPRAIAVALAGGAAALGLAWYVSYGCAIYDPSLLVGADAQSDGGDEGVVAEGGDEAEAGPVTCPETFPPPPPSKDDPSDAGDQSFVAALHTIDVGLDSDGGPPAVIGYDLDRVFTCCDGGAESCKPVVTGAQHCDQAGGRDNSAGMLLASFASLDPAQFNSTTISQRLQAGVYSILLQVLHYNGTPNDRQVTAAVYASGGIASADGGQGAAQWDGHDAWTVDSDFVLSGGNGTPILPSHFDSNAYVADGVLVMAIDFPLSLGTSGTGSLTVTLSGAHITGNIGAVAGGGYNVHNGQIAGRWSVPQLLASLESLSLAGSPICRGSFSYTGVKQQICHSADITSDPSLDRTGAICDALSVGFGFSADPALLGQVTTPSVKVSPCKDGGSDAATPPPDTCP